MKNYLVKYLHTQRKNRRISLCFPQLLVLYHDLCGPPSHTKDICTVDQFNSISLNICHDENIFSPADWSYRGFNQLVFLQGRRFVVYLKVILAVRCQTEQDFTAFCLILVQKSQVTSPCMQLLQISELPGSSSFFSLSTISASSIVQNRPGAKCLCALGTAEDPQMIFFVPKIINAFYAVPVPTWYSHSKTWYIQTYQTAKLFCIPEPFHFVVVYCREMFEMKKMPSPRSSSQFCTDVSAPHPSVLPI